MRLFDFLFPPSKSKQNCRKKRKFTSNQDAQAAIKRINPKKSSNKPSRAYKCPECRNFHLTSQKQ